MSHSVCRWWDAGLHSLYPGAGEPVEHVKRSRLRVDGRWLARVVHMLDNPNVGQRYAVGVQIVRLLSGKDVTIQNILRSTNLTKIIANYITDYMTDAAFAGAAIEVPDADARCTFIDTNGGARCYCERDHESAGKGGCKFTVPNIPSPATVRPPHSGTHTHTHRFDEK